jgi:hypothetical protein
MAGWTTLYGQFTTIAGVVADSISQAPVAGVIIQLLDRDGKVLHYTFSQADGTFSLPCPDDGNRLLFKSMGYRECWLSVPESKFPVKILLADAPVQLRDIVVQAPDILMKNDTLVYNVQKYADAQDRSIADVLKKMPGIEVAESGQIKYNGLPINKFYIEGNDLLEGRYGLASNNISHSDVQNVEIMENHQPIRALQGIDYSEQAGLNLHLKESAKLRWSGVVNGGTGFSPALYDASLFAMRIAGKRQSMETARINNTGWNPASQSARYTSDNLFGTTFNQNLLPDYITGGEYTTPIEDRRTRFNRSYLFNTTHSFQLKKDYDLKAHITYERDNLDFTRNAYTDYLEPFLSPLTENEEVRKRAHTLSGQWTLQSNTSGMYLKNNLSVDLGWNNATSTVSGSYNITQKAEKPVYSIANELQAVKRIKNRILTLSSSLRIVNKAHALWVENEEKQAFQDVAARAFQSVTEVRYGWIFGPWQVQGRAGVKSNYKALESNLTGINTDPFPSVNHSRLSITDLYVRPEIVYENKYLRLNPSVAMHYYGYDFNEKNSEDPLTRSYGVLSPALFVQYKFTARLEMFADIRYVVTPPPADIFYRGAILNNYRNLTIGYPSGQTDTGASIAWSLRYRNPVSSVFANAGFKYEKNHDSLTEEQLFVNDQLWTTYRPIANSGDRYRFNGGVSKGIFSGKIHIGMDVGYTQTQTAALRNSIVVPYQLHSISWMSKIKGTIFKWMATEYTFLAGKNTLDVETRSAGTAFLHWKQKWNVSLFPVKKIQAYIGIEQYYTKFNDRTANPLLLLDAGVRWTVSDKIAIHLSATNLLNADDYRYSRHETLSETTYRYPIRPRNVMISAQLQF